MKFKNVFKVFSIVLLGAFMVFTSCAEDGIDGKDGIDGENGSDGQDGTDGKDGENGMDVTYFATAAKISLGDGVPEISAYDVATKTVFSTNSEAKEVEVIDISDIKMPQVKNPIDVTLYSGNVNSVACKQWVFGYCCRSRPCYR